MNKFVFNILNRNLTIYLIAVLVLCVSVRWPQVAEKRSLYLLGIFYNGYFQNYHDAQVYFDYLKRQHSQMPPEYASRVPLGILEEEKIWNK